MYRRWVMSLVAVVLAVFQGGCGTLVNLTAAPTEPRPHMACMHFSDVCAPMGGWGRDLWFGAGCLLVPKGSAHELLRSWGCTEYLGKTEPIVAAGMSPGVMGAGVVMLAVDMPLSFAGDLLTLPIALAREKQAPWAIWWGKQSVKGWDEGLYVRSPQLATDRLPEPSTLSEPVDRDEQTK